MGKGEPLRTSKDVLVHLDFIRRKKQEHLVCLSLDGGMRLIRKRTVTIGLVDQVLAHPREVFAGPITDRATWIIVAHNHPSGLAEPSTRDIEMTHQLAAAGQLIGIPMSDHIIMTSSLYYSFRHRGLLCGQSKYTEAV